MARPKKTEKTASLKITVEAHRLAGIAAGYAGESIGEYASRVLAEIARRDIERGHAALAAESKRPKKGGE